MDAKITRTRVIIPQRRPDQLSRPRVLKRLFDLSKHKLVIVVAPPGYGKTSLLIDFADKVNQSVCWYAIDSLDQNPSRFFAHLVASVTQIQPGFGRECHLALQELLANNGALIDLVPTIVNELYDHVAEKITLVLDDFHLVQENSEIQEFLNAFIQQVEDSCQIVLSSRRLIRLPDLPLMVARSLVGGISMEDLCFQTDEIQALIAENFGEAIDEDAALELIDKTEGWITGLLLSTQLNQQNAFGSGSLYQPSLQRATGVDLYDYLAQQVFLRQEPEIQTFLLRTSLLNEFNEDFCQQIFVPEIYPAETDWQQLMDAVVANNLFILPVGDGKPWFRYHNLFSEFLSRRVHKEFPQEAAPILEQLAEHYIQEQAWEQAYQVRKQQGNVDALADMIEESVLSLMQECQLLLCKQWLDDLPEHVFSVRPILLATKGYVYATNDSLTDGFTLLARAVDDLSTTTSTIEYATALAWIASVYRLMGKTQLALQTVDTALELLERLDDERLRSNKLDGGNQGPGPIVDGSRIANFSSPYWTLKAESLRVKGVVLCMMGRATEGIQYIESAVNIYDTFEDSARGAIALMDLATSRMDIGHYEEAKSLFQNALLRTSTHSRQQPRIHILNNLGVLYHLSGNYIKAYDVLNQAVDSSRHVQHTYLRALSIISLGELWMDLDDAAAAKSCFREALSLIDGFDLPYLKLYIDIANAQLACAEESWAEAFDSLDRAGRTVARNPQQPGWYNYKIAMGQFYLAREKNQQAVVMFSEALANLKGAGKYVEESQTCLLLAYAHHRLGEAGCVQERLGQAATTVNELLIWQPLIVKGRSVLDMLQQVASSNENTYTDEIQLFASDLISRIDHFEKQLDTIRLQLVSSKDKLVNGQSARGADYALTIRTLGRIDIVYNGNQIKNWHGKTHIVRDLFFCFLAHKDGLTKEEIGSIFWPDSAPAELKVRFKNAIYRVRKAIAPDVLVFDRDLYRLNPDLDTYCDANAFEEAIAEARGATVDLHEKEAYQRALAIYTGDYLIEIEAMWAWLERERLAQLHQDASLRLAELHLEYGEISEALQLCHRLLASEPCLEEAHRIIMQLHAANGNRIALVRQYELCEQALQDEFGAQPSEQTRSLFISLTS